MSNRLDIKKTYKLFVGGKFPRSESGRYLPARSAKGEPLDNYAHASRKDFRDAVVAARAAFDGWNRATAYNRGQVLYRAAEMLQNRAAELAAEIARSTNAGPARARREVALTIDRLVHFAGWTDKYQQVFGSVNPVATPHFNFTVPEPMGVVAVLAPDEPALLALISLVAPVILSGNTAIVIPSERFPLPAATFAEILATSDLPGGVVNLLTGLRKEIVPTFATHAHLRAVCGVASAAERKTLGTGAAESVKRVVLLPAEEPPDWYADTAQSLYPIRELLEFKTTWHPVGA